MKKNILFLFLLTTTFSFGQVPQDFQEQVVAFVDSLPLNTQMAFGITDGQNRYFLGVKKTNKEVNTIDNKDALFQIGSVTKVFTSTLLSEAIINLGVDAHKPLKKIKELEVNSKTNYTLMQLSNHTSGLMRLPSNFASKVTSMLQPYENYSMADLHAYIMRKPMLLNKPGESYSYSNLGVAILGMELATLYHNTYENLVDSLVFQKYNMTHSSFSNDDLVEGLNDQGKKVRPWAFQAFEPTGAAVSNVSDMLNFLDANLTDTNAVLDLQRLQTFEVDDNMAIAMGWHILKNKQGKRFYWHNGATGGYSSSVALDRNGSFGIVCLTNINGTSNVRQNVDLLTFELLAQLKK